MIIVVGSILKIHRNFFTYAIIQITYAVCSTSVFFCKMKMLPKFLFIFIVGLFIFKLFFSNMIVCLIKIYSYTLLINGIIFFFSKLTIFISCSLKNSFHALLKTILQSLSLCKLCLFPMSSNIHIVDIEYPQGICSPIFVVDHFLGLFSHSSTFQSKT